MRLILHIRRTNAREYHVQAPWNALRTTQKRPTIDERRDLKRASTLAFSPMISKSTSSVDLIYLNIYMIIIDSRARGDPNRSMGEFEGLPAGGGNSVAAPPPSLTVLRRRPGMIVLSLGNDVL